MSDSDYWRGQALREHLSAIRERDEHAARIAEMEAECDALRARGVDAVIFWSRCEPVAIVCREPVERIAPPKETT